MKLSTLKNVKLGMLAGAFLLGIAIAGAQEGGRQRRGFGGPGGPGFGRGGGLLMLAMRSDVQRDLNVTAEQKKSLEELIAKQREARGGQGERRRERRGGEGQRGQGAGAPDAGPGNFNPEEARRMMEQRREQSRKELAAILSDAQMKRLDEISIQLRGVRAVLDPEVQKGIGLTEDQNVKIRDLMQKMQEANRSLMEKARNEEITREDAMAARENNEKALEVELNKLLSQTQKSKLKDLSGKPFQAEPQQFQRGSGRRPGRG